MKPQSEPFQEAPFTAFPNALIDYVMPTLKDTEWRVLCVIVRQTIGWSEKGRGRKQRDWLSQRQLMARTGRNSAALSAAIDVLVRRRLVSAWDEAGELLLTPYARRKHQSRIYYGLCSDALSVPGSTKTPLHKANTTKETEYKRKVKDKEAATPPRWAQSSPAAFTIHKGWERAGRVAAGRFEIDKA